jgi:hypothetical protein
MGVIRQVFLLQRLLIDLSNPLFQCFTLRHSVYKYRLIEILILR